MNIFKEIVNLKMKMSLLLILSCRFKPVMHYMPVLLPHFLLWKTKYDIFKNVANQTASVPIDLHRIFLFIRWKSVGTKTV